MHVFELNFCTNATKVGMPTDSIYTSTPFVLLSSGLNNAQVNLVRLIVRDSVLLCARRPRADR